MSEALDLAIIRTRKLLLSLQASEAHWEGELANSALATATAVVALTLVDEHEHASVISRGAFWLAKNQNEGGGWGDTTISKSNLSTSLLCWSALSLVTSKSPVTENLDQKREILDAIQIGEAWISQQVGGISPEQIAAAVIARYGKDKTFSVPILMLCAICGTLGPQGWRHVLQLPFELAALPRTWFGAVGLPVVSYALPALIAIGYTRFYHRPPAPWNPWGWLRQALWTHIGPMLRHLQPSSGGYLEATPLTSFVIMALASADERSHPCVPAGVEFLLRSVRNDGSWPIDTNLATWGTTLAVKALAAGAGDAGLEGLDQDRVSDWLLNQQYHVRHPFTYAEPGGWAWTDLPGGVPDADDTSGALVALHYLELGAKTPVTFQPAAEAGIIWLLDLQNRDGGIPTFCRGWGTLPFDRSTPEITAHALWAWQVWRDHVSPALQTRIDQGTAAALSYLEHMLHPVRRGGSGFESPYGDQMLRDGGQRLPWWQPLWFGNEHTATESNPVLGTALVLSYVWRAGLSIPGVAAEDQLGWLLSQQLTSGGWGGDITTAATVEETANVIKVLAVGLKTQKLSRDLSHALRQSIEGGVQWLLQATDGGQHYEASPIGLYFARLWYHEKMYPVVWALEAFQLVHQALSSLETVASGNSVTAESCHLASPASRSSS